MLAETKADLLRDLGLEEQDTPALQQLIAGDSRYIKDLRMNYKGLLRLKQLSEKEVFLIALSVANNNGNAALQKAFTAKAKKAEATEGEIAEALACASLLRANNVMYRFRHFMNKDSYDKMRMGLRMQIMMKPVLGKELFELMSLVISAVNGCEMCVRAHEESLLKLDSSEDRIFEATRIGAVITSLGTIVY